MQTFAKRLDEALHFRKIKPADLARATKLTEGQISAYRKGTYKAKQDNIYIIAKALNISEAWLMGHDVSMERVPDDLRSCDGSNLTVMEITLIKDFRKLNPAGQEKACAAINDLTEIPKYTKTEEC